MLLAGMLPGGGRGTGSLWNNGQEGTGASLFSSIPSSLPTSTPSSLPPPSLPSFSPRKHASMSHDRPFSLPPSLPPSLSSSHLQGSAGLAIVQLRRFPPPVPALTYGLRIPPSLPLQRLPLPTVSDVGRGGRGFVLFLPFVLVRGGGKEGGREGGREGEREGGGGFTGRGAGEKGASWKALESFQ
jgi:hypothetical protein